MSSVTRFLRQIPTGGALYGGNTLSNLSTSACVFVPTSGNYVGNYPPGLVSQAPLNVRNAIGTLATGFSQTQNVVRDMGKTIFAQTATSYENALAGTGSGSFGYFRELQVLLPQAITSAQGFIGGPSGSVFGVQGGQVTEPNAYLTIYVPTTVAGVMTLPSGVTTIVTNGPQGQM